MEMHNVINHIKNETLSNSLKRFMKEIDFIKNNTNIIADNFTKSQKFKIDYTKLDFEFIHNFIFSNKNKVKLILPSKKCFFDIGDISIYATTEDCDDDKIKFIPFILYDDLRLRMSNIITLIDINTYSVRMYKYDKIPFDVDKEILMSEDMIKITSGYLIYILLRIIFNDEPSLFLDNN